MNIDLIVIGKTDLSAVGELVDMYQKRINFYIKFNTITIPDLRNTKNLSVDGQKKQEGDLLMRMIGDGDYVVLLDERGKEYQSVEFAGWMQKRMNSGSKRLCLLIGGPYGFSPELYARANESISLSKMTFSHQIIRAILAEQLYRCFTILNNEPYHHQ